MGAVRGIIKGGFIAAGCVTLPLGIAKGVENIHEMRESSGAFISDEVRGRTSEAFGPLYSVSDYGTAILKHTGGIVEGVVHPGDTDPGRSFGSNVLIATFGVAALRRGIAI
jgi:hypothetical protein